MAQQILSVSKTTERSVLNLRPWLPLIVFAGAIVVFLAAPWPLHVKAHTVLHGLCAQIPSHTWHLGHHALPFDSRMTGIYSAVAATMIAIGSRTRFRPSGIPSIGMVALLAAGVLAMAVDGFNSLFRDMGYWHLYQPHNWLRVATGAGCGVALAVTLAWLIGSSLWATDTRDQRAVSWLDLGRGAAIWSLFGFALLSDSARIYPLVTMVLVVSAVGTICTISYLMLVLTRATNNLKTSYSELGLESVAGIVLGFAVVATLAGLRFLAEHYLGMSVTLS